VAPSDGMTHPYAVSIALASGKTENLIDPESVSAEHRHREPDPSAPHK
jgi:hypothetical protein